MIQFLKKLIILITGCFAYVMVSGCATPANGRSSPGKSDSENATTNITPHVVSYEDYNDPIESFNRGVFAFNHVTYRYVLIPLADGYMWIMPDPVERGVGNFFYTVKTPIYAVNHLAQLKPVAAGKNVLRFGINATIGLLGFFDPAEAWFNLERQETHLEDTLAQYGLEYQMYLVIPILGPSDVRNGLSEISDSLLNPLVYLVPFPESTIVQGVDYLQENRSLADRYMTLYKKSEDPYIFFRNLYLQGVQRDADY